MQSPVIEALDQEMGEQVGFHKLDVDANHNVAEQFQIMSIPTLMITKDGQVVDQLIGYHSKEQVAQLLKQYL